MEAAGQRVDADAITFEMALLAAEGGGASKVRQGLVRQGLGFRVFVRHVFLGAE